jgi:hypothetical protein
MFGSISVWYYIGFFGTISIDYRRKNSLSRFAFQKQLHNYAALLLNKIVTLQPNFE